MENEVNISVYKITLDQDKNVWTKCVYLSRIKWSDLGFRGYCINVVFVLFSLHSVCFASPLWLPN